MSLLWAYKKAKLQAKPNVQITLTKPNTTMLLAHIFCKISHCHGVSETLTQNIMKIRGRENFRCLSSWSTLCWSLFHKRYVLSTHIKYMWLILVSPPGVILGRVDTFEGFYQTCSQYHFTSVSLLVGLLVQWNFCHGSRILIFISQGLDVDCQINFICNLKFKDCFVVVLLMSQSLPKPVMVPKTEECCALCNQQSHRSDKLSLAHTDYLQLPQKSV